MDEFDFRWHLANGVQQAGRCIDRCVIWVLAFLFVGSLLSFVWNGVNGFGWDVQCLVGAAGAVVAMALYLPLQALGEWMRAWRGGGEDDDA